MKNLLCIAAAVLGLSTSVSAGTVNIIWTESGSAPNVQIVMKGSGSIDLTGMTGPTAADGGGIGWGPLFFGDLTSPGDVYTGIVPVDGYTELGGGIPGISTSGDKFGFEMTEAQTGDFTVPANITLPQGYKSGDPISFEWKYVGPKNASDFSFFIKKTTLAFFGPDDNQKQNQITIARGSSDDLSSVPLPAGLPLMLIGLGGLAVVSHRRTQKKSS